MTRVAPLDAGTVLPVMNLEVAEAQRGLVAPNAVTLAQSIYEPASEVLGLFDGEKPVGLMAFIDTAHPEAELDEGDPTDALYLWRLMVAEGVQGKGHGRAALDHLETLARARERRQLLTSAVPADGTAIPFYERLGFTRTGRMPDNEVELAKVIG